jgi:hypothetical protein
MILQSHAIQHRIKTLRREVRNITAQIKIAERRFGVHDDYINRLNKVRYDQIEELSAELHRQKLALSQENILEDWCEMNPSDFECRVYDS